MDKKETKKIALSAYYFAKHPSAKEKKKTRKKIGKVGKVETLLRREYSYHKMFSANRWIGQLNQLFKNPCDTGYRVKVDKQFTECNLLFEHWFYIEAISMIRLQILWLELLHLGMDLLWAGHK